MSISHIETALKKCETRDRLKLQGMVLYPPLLTLNKFSCNCKRQKECFTTIENHSARCCDDKVNRDKKDYSCLINYSLKLWNENCEHCEH